MKSFFKILGIVIVLAAMIFNVHISRISGKGNLTLAYVRNVAQAQTEGTTTYKNKDERTGNSTVEHVNTDGSICTETYDFDFIICTGQGQVQCTPTPPGGGTSNQQYTGDCPFH